MSLAQSSKSPKVLTSWECRVRWSWCPKISVSNCDPWLLLVIEVTKPQNSWWKLSGAKFSIFFFISYQTPDSQTKPQKDPSEYEGKIPFFQGWQSMGTGYSERLGNPFLWRYSKCTWMWSCTTHSRWIYFSRGFELDNLPMAFPIPTSLWYCDLFLYDVWISSAPSLWLCPWATHCAVVEILLSESTRCHSLLLQLLRYFFSHCKINLDFTSSWAPAHHSTSCFQPLPIFSGPLPLPYT